ncbi:GNAT family N-acetyltransferase [Streptomyces lichenis]|uniref:GNAT family N-acetyltransferase n=1 Tax=Streptomyces lichenis TaxID=2306967 RepID=A0ABT0I4H3_9ACTN|nr:GNAT family N-acetyltransferase [Streptomyces lichenis]MCK8676182.1 GNAT family N-acetyltransferase [Streptomyces lichenis]
MTPDPEVRLTIGGEDQDLSDRLDRELTAYNSAAVDAEEAEVSVRAEDASGALVGGLTASTWGTLGSIHMLWVDPAHRASGLGGRLMAAAEEEARRRGCTVMEVSSYTFQAPPFYRRLGYTETGRIEGVPGGHADVHLTKPLAPAPNPPFHLTAIVDYPSDHTAPARAAEEAALALLPRHGGHLERRLITPDGRSEVHLLRFPSESAYRAYLADPDRPDPQATGTQVRVLEVGEVHG